jgi:uncharacterized coiled-coil protein SlyX
VDRSDDKTEARVDELEARLAQQDDSILALSDEIYRQQKRIVGLEVEVRELVERLKSLMAQTVTDSQPETPPHY